MQNVKQKSPDDTEVLKKLYRNYCERMIYYSRQITGDEETARDIVQESFMIYWKSRHNVSCDEKSIRNFLYVTVKHASLKWLRKQSIAEDYLDRKSTRLNSSHSCAPRMPSYA